MPSRRAPRRFVPGLLASRHSFGDVPRPGQGDLDADAVLASVVGCPPPLRSLTPSRRPLSEQRGRRCGAAEICPERVAFWRGIGDSRLLLSRQTAHVLGDSRALRAISPDRAPHRHCCATPSRASDRPHRVARRGQTCHDGAGGGGAGKATACSTLASTASA